MPRIAQGRGNIPVLRPGDTVTFSTSTSPANSAAIPGVVVRLYSTADCFYKVGTGATSGDAPLNAGIIEHIRIDQGETISAVLASGTGTFFVTVMG